MASLCVSTALLATLTWPTAARAAPPADAVFPASPSTPPAVLHALCVAASLPVGHPSLGSRRGVGVLTPRDTPDSPYAWVWVDTQAQSPEELEAYKMMVNSLKRGVQGYSAVCLPSTTAQLDHTVVTFVVEHANPKGTYLVVAGTMAHAKAASVTGTSEDARRRAAQLARDLTGEPLTWANGVDGAWQQAFAVPESSSSVRTTKMAPLFGERTADAGDQGGLGLRGSDPAVASTPPDGAADRDVTMTPGMPVILGSLDSEIIRHVVREHADELRFCYASELRRTPGISGKVTMKWVINDEGKVAQAATAQTEMNNANVESCLAARIKGWVFPRPKGGGIAVVNYPFRFKPSG